MLANFLPHIDWSVNKCSWTNQERLFPVVSSRVHQGLGPRLSLDNLDHHSPWHLLLPWFHQLSGVPSSWKKWAPWTLQRSTIFGVSIKFVRFSTKFWSLNVTIRNNMENIIYIPCKWSKHIDNKWRPWKYKVTPLKRKVFCCQNIGFRQFCPNFKLVVIYALFPPPRLGQVLSFPPIPSLYTHFNPFSYTGDLRGW